ncbi:GDSL esterase/lipase At4g10955-like [Carya illinoinensis]|uniref:GDSL esterase/lipase At4g10955-like n=1 Tax=Carya illinoinensis TaxID=32201 RepID=UPI001C725F20|nr:GDSL esterase/lipase At4g10955-like [Carya illinoinensis]
MGPEEAFSKFNCKTALNSVFPNPYISLCQKRAARGKKAEPLWTSFNFDLDQTLIYGKCIFSAIYKYNGKYPVTHDSNVPKYVIAFQGTLLNPNKLEGSSRFELAMHHFERLVEANGAPNVWLAGHSLGSAIALLIGKKMILKKKWFPNAYLFNPPFLALRIEILKDTKVKKGIRCVHRMLKARLTLAAQPSNYTRLEDHFALLSSWTPHMFVSRADIICAAYIAYFKRRVFENLSHLMIQHDEENTSQFLIVILDIPEYVIAFQGTLLMPEIVMDDTM